MAGETAMEWFGCPKEEEVADGEQWSRQGEGR